MRPLRLLDHYRLCSHEVVRFFGSIGDDNGGVFLVPSEIDGGTLKVVASNGEGWDHISVSRQNRCPNWPEMEQIKRLFFSDNEVAMQLHVRAKDHINCHPYCLHIWRPHDVDIPLPPKAMVGPEEAA